ncbi:MAG TPA: hypothetical protein VG388_11920 [Solirubrobacteraceae bacterium]|jgi:hypothetical protein|nr:hypothetical protein [Solirubrobacteraceae bacterium]
MTAAELWERGQAGWPRAFPIAQFPNPPLIAAFAGWGLATLTEGTGHDVGRGLLVLGLTLWAVEEVASGANWFRRLLGAGALAGLVAKLASAA